MEKQLIASISAVQIILSSTLGIGMSAQPQPTPKKVLVEHKISLAKRYPDPWVNNVFKDNILLNLAYLEGRVKTSTDVKWDVIEKPFEYSFSLKPGEVFAYHEDVLPEFKGKVASTTNAHFNSQEGFLSDGYLVGDGVCHLASLINWVALDAGLTVKVPTNHDFAPIPEIDRKYGVAIYNQAGAAASSAQQNLYITNNRQKPAKFHFEYKNDILSLSIEEEN